MKYSILSLFLFFFLTIQIGQGFAQSNDDKRTEVEKAHDDKGKAAEFSPTDHQRYKVKLYAVKPPRVDQLHHWFLHVLDANGLPVDYATISMDAYLEDNAEVKLTYMGPITYLCGEGKYVIGFVNVKYSGIWELKIAIENIEGIRDQITLKMNVDEQESNL